MRVAVTGGTGFVGSVLCAKLMRRGHDVVTVARGPGATAAPATRARDPNAPVLRHRRGDVATGAGLHDAFAGADAVVNLVAASPLLPAGHRRRYRELHVRGAENVVRECRRSGVSRLVHVGALGVTPGSLAPYARTKARGEHVVLSSGIRATVLSPSILFGDRSELVRFLDRVASLPVVPLPVIATPFAPLHVEDFATVLADAVTRTGPADPERLEVVGPQIVTGTEFARLYLNARGCGTIPVARSAVSGVLELAWRLHPPAVPYQLARMLGLSNIATGQSPVIVTHRSYADWCRVGI